MRKKLSKEEKAERKAKRKERRAEAMAEVRRGAAMFGGTRVIKFDGHETIVPVVSKDRYVKGKQKGKEKASSPISTPTFSWSSTAQTIERIEPVSVKEIEKKGKIGKAIKTAGRVSAKVEAGRKFGESLFGGFTENIVEGGLMPGTWVKPKKRK